MHFEFGKDDAFHIVFQPTGLFNLTGIPSFQLTNLYLDAECMFPESIISTYEQLQHVKTYHEILAIADEFIESLVRNARTDTNLPDGVSKTMLECDDRLNFLNNQFWSHVIFYNQLTKSIF